MKDYLKSLKLKSKLVLIYSVLVIVVSSISNICSLIYCICVDYTSSAPRTLIELFNLVKDNSVFLTFSYAAVLNPYFPIITIVSMIMTITLIVNIGININSQNFEERLLKPILLSLLNPSIILMIYLELMLCVLESMS